MEGATIWIHQDAAVTSEISAIEGDYKAIIRRIGPECTRATVKCFYRLCHTIPRIWVLVDIDWKGCVMLFAIPQGMSQCGNCLRRSRLAARGLVGRSFAC